jgi:hypothetical protein
MVLLATAFPEGTAKAYDWRIYPLALPAKCDLLHTYFNILILLRAGGQFASV